MKTYLVPSLRLFEVMNKADSDIQPKFLYKQSILEGEKVTLYIGGEDFIINVPKDDNYDAMYVYSWNHKDPVIEEYTILLGTMDKTFQKEYRIFQMECMLYLIIYARLLRINIIEFLMDLPDFSLYSQVDSIAIFLLNMIYMEPMRIL